VEWSSTHPHPPRPTAPNFFEETYVINTCLLMEVFYIHSNCSKGQAVSRRPLTEDGPVRSQASPCEKCGGKSDTGIGALSISVFPWHYHSNNAPYSYFIHPPWMLCNLAVYSAGKYNASLYLPPCTVFGTSPFRITTNLIGRSSLLYVNIPSFPPNSALDTPMELPSFSGT
jgi:hypothetical protein